MTINPDQNPDQIDLKVRAARHQEWITEWWREIPFTKFTLDGQLEFVFDLSCLPRLGGLYAVNAILFPHHLNQAIIHRRGSLLKIADRLPDWVDETRRSQRFIHPLYIGATDDFPSRWSGHEKMIDLKAFQEQMIEMRFYVYAEPPYLEPEDNRKGVTEKILIDVLSPLLNFH